MNIIDQRLIVGFNDANKILLRVTTFPTPDFTQPFKQAGACCLVEVKPLFLPSVSFFLKKILTKQFSLNPVADAPHPPIIKYCRIYGSRRTSDFILLPKIMRNA